MRCVTRVCVLRALEADGLFDKGPRAAIAPGDRDVVLATAPSFLKDEEGDRERDPEDDCE